MLMMCVSPIGHSKVARRRRPNAIIAMAKSKHVHTKVEVQIKPPLCVDCINTDVQLERIPKVIKLKKNAFIFLLICLQKFQT